MAQRQTFSFHTTHQTQLGKKQKLFYTTTPWYLIQRLIRTWCPSITNEQYLNTIAQGHSILEQRKLFLFERCHKVIIEKWILLFKCPMKFYTFFNVAQLFYKGFYSAELMLQYLQPENKKQNYFLITQWITQCQHFSILLKIFTIIKKYSQPPTIIKTRDSSVTFDERVPVKIILKDQNYGFNYFIPHP